MNTSHFLVEIGCEELPPLSLKLLGEAFKNAFSEELAQASLSFDNIYMYASPRRLALSIEALQTVQEDRSETLTGPPERIAFDDNKAPTKAALAFAKKCGVSVDTFKPTGDANHKLKCTREVKGQCAEDLLCDMVERALTKLPIPRPMRWADHNHTFVRPVHWVVLMLDNKIVEGQVLGINTGNKTFGHRVHAPKPITLKHASEYAAKLKQGKVIASFYERQDMIEKALNDLKPDINVLWDDALVHEVTALVEWPVAVVGHFDKRFLDLPDEVLISTLQKHQRYFPVCDDNGDLLPHFVTVANLESKDPKQVKLGNERVITPRLQDAEFFWQQDQATSLDDRAASLDHIVFEKTLGSLGDKVKRVTGLAENIAHAMDWPKGHVTRAASLAKVDLSTNMVAEFPDLQGTVGKYYAHEEAPEVARAIEEHYWPKFAGDNLPEAPVSLAIAIADKLDTVCGLFAIDRIPTGSRDPFALRRQALGILRMLIERSLDLDLFELIQTSLSLQPVKAKDGVVNQVFDFFMERLKTYYIDQHEFNASMFASVLANHPTKPADFDARLRAIFNFSQQEGADDLAAANKRIKNMLSKHEKSNPELNEALLSASAETSLLSCMKQAKKEVTPMLSKQHYAEALERLAQLREPIDTFFDEVMVMDDNLDLREARLALLYEVHELFSHTADISLLQAA